MSDLNDLFKQLAEAKANDPKQKIKKQIEESVKIAVKTDIGSLFQELSKLQKQKEEIEEQLPIVEELKQEVISEVVVPSPIGPVPQETQVSPIKVDQYIKPAAPTQQVAPLTNELKQVNDKIKFLERWIGQIQNAGPGSGEVNFRYLDDVNRGTMTPSNDNWVLEYDAATGDVKFTNQIGPIDLIRFDTNHTHEETRLPGTLCWGATDRTLNIEQPGGVTQQVGQENFVLAKNMTGSTITNGSFVGFAGASMNGEARILVSPFLANGVNPNLYGLGVATQDVLDDDMGFITTFGKVRELNTTGSDVGETWQLGDILYASPTNAGKFTRVKPTAPNNVIPAAAVLYVHETEGEIFVRPTYEQKMNYGRFSDTTDQAPVAINTPYAVTFNTTTISNGVVLGTPTSRIVVDQSGFYDFVFSLSLTSTNSSAKAFYVWGRKNGVDIPYSTKRQSITGNGTYQVLVGNLAVSMNANDYIEIMYASSDTAISINSPASIEFAPAIPSATVTVVQIAL